MAFRATESAQQGLEQVEAYLVPRPQYADKQTRERSRAALLDIVDDIGPVVDSYPTWHPLVRGQEIGDTVATPSTRCKYSGLDHTRYLANGFITCPYGDGEEVIESVNDLPYHPIARITAERIDAKLYNPEASPILVKCNWNKPLGRDGMIPLSIALPLLLEMEIPCWQSSQVGETWETMRYYFLGSPHGARSSLFVNQETGQAIKKIWNSLINTGMFGPLMVGRD